MVNAMSCFPPSRPDADAYTATTRTCLRRLRPASVKRSQYLADHLIYFTSGAGISAVINIVWYGFAVDMVK